MVACFALVATYSCTHPSLIQLKGYCPCSTTLHVSNVFAWLYTNSASWCMSSAAFAAQYKFISMFNIVQIHNHDELKSRSHGKTQSDLIADTSCDQTVLIWQLLWTRVSARDATQTRISSLWPGHLSLDPVGLGALPPSQICPRIKTQASSRIGDICVKVKSSSSIHNYMHCNRRFDNSTIPPFHYSTIRWFDYSTIRQLHHSTIQRFDDSTIQPLNHSTFQPFDDSTTSKLHHLMIR